MIIFHFSTNQLADYIIKNDSYARLQSTAMKMKRKLMNNTAIFE